MGQILWSKHRSTLQDNSKYIQNYILKPFIFLILRYAECAHDMHDIAKYVPPTSMKIQEKDEVDWDVPDGE